MANRNRFAILSIYPIGLYSPLSSDRRETRLLSVLPASSWTDPLICNLSVVSLLDEPRYKALSYVWGSKDHTRQIEVNDNDIEVTSNLVFALKRVRQKDQILSIWVDALCINQDNIKERNQQVQMMSSIYETAEEVLVCLDDDEEVNKYFISVFDMMDAAIQAWRQWKKRPLHSRGPIEDYDDALLRDFIDTAWWNRVWTAQEFLLARSVKFYFFNDRPMTVDDVDDFISYLQVPKKWENGSTYYEQDELFYAKNIRKLIELRRGYQSQTRSVDALSLVAFSRYRRASDHRDKIYAFIGLSPALGTLVNYEVTLQDCYEEFALSTIMSRQDLDIFNHLHVRNGQMSTGREVEIKSLASWAPNWSLELPLSDLHAFDDRSPQINFYRACANTKAIPERAGLHRLKVVGSICGKIQQVGNPFDSTGLNFKEALTDWLELSEVQGHDKLANIASFRLAVTQGLPAKWILSMNKLSKNIEKIQTAFRWRRRYSELDESLYRRLLEWLPIQQSKEDEERIDLLIHKSQHGLNDNFAQYVYFVYRSVKGRRFLVDDLGRFGFVPGRSKAGDLICVLHGGKTAYVLREVVQDPPSLEAGNETATYEILGDAYVNGVMWGEAVQAAVDGELQTRDFILV